MHSEKARELMVAHAVDSDEHLDGIPGGLEPMPAATTIHIIVDTEIAVVPPCAVTMYQGHDCVWV